MRNKSSGLIWLVLSLALVCLMPSNQSLWIDEGYTAQYAQEGSFAQFMSRLDSEKGSEALMPLGMVSSWAGAKVFGRSEFGLRVVSALWAGVAILLFWRTGALIGFAWLPALIACHAFLWYHGGEVRPYVMVIAMSAGLLYAFVAVLWPGGETKRGLHALLLFGPLLCATYVLGFLPFAAVAGVVGIELLRKQWKPRTRDLLALVISGGALILLGLYYARVISAGADINQRPWGVGLKSLLFSGYELLGFLGFGPGRYQLRQSVIESGIGGALQGFAPPTMMGVAMLAFLYTLILLRFWKCFPSRRSAIDRLALLALLVIAVTVGAMLAICSIAGSPFWGRHLASLLPFVVLTVGIAATTPTRTHQRQVNVLLFLLAATLLTSSLLVRFGPNHRRDDYRSAASIARLAVQEGKTVWWTAGRVSAEYYGLVFCTADPTSRRACVIHTDNRDKEELETLPAPELILISKPAFHDTTGAMRNYAVEHRFQLKRRLTAFEVFESP